jgi:hypothetical protein
MKEIQEILPFIILVLTLFLLCLCGHLFTNFFMMENFINEINSEDDLFEILISLIFILISIVVEKKCC